VRSRGVPLRLLTVVAALTIAPGVARGDDGETARTLARQLTSPVAAERADAVRAAVERGAAARAWAVGWVAAPDPALRAAGWEVLARVGVAADARAAQDALSDDQPSVAREAGQALLEIAARLPLGAEPWMPAGSIGPGQARVLAFALAARLEGAPVGSVPPWLTHLGEGVVPCLAHLLRHPRFDATPRASALAALAAVGGDEARRALGDLVPWLEAHEDSPLWGGWWQALVEIGPGNGLEEVHALVVRAAATARWDGVITMPGLGRRNQGLFYRFVAACPPAEGAEVVRDLLDHQFERAAEAQRWRIWPLVLADAVRAHLVVAGPDDRRLTWDVLAARPLPRRGWGRWQEELGEVLVVLEPYAARSGVQAGLEELLRRRDLSGTVRAWALHLRGETPRDELRAMAADLIDADGGTGSAAQRRLGALLLERLGGIAPDRIRAMLADFDPSLRAQGLRWACAASGAGRLAPHELEVALLAALRDADPEAFLVAAGHAPERLDRAGFARLVELGLGGPRDQRGRAWEIVDRVVDRTGTADADPFPAPAGNAGLDERLRAAALAWRLWER